MIFKNRWHRNYFIRRYLYGPMLILACAVLYRCRFLVPEKWYRIDRPIFILGVSRSGTTLFVEEFGRHPELCNWSEAAQILDLDFYDPNVDTQKDEADLVAKDSFRIQALFGLRMRCAGKNRFVNKHPENSLRVRYLDALFPDALFIHLIRDAFPVIESNYRITLDHPFRKNWPFGQFPKPPNWKSYLPLTLPEQFAHQWVDIIEYVRNTAGKLDARYLELRYEDFCADPRAVLREAYEFCGVKPDSRHEISVPDRFPNQNLRWRESFDADQIAEINSIVGELYLDLGYDRKSL